MSFETAIVIGAGAFGTSIASVLSHNFKKVILKVRSNDVYETLKTGENSIYLPGQKLAGNLFPALTWEEVEELKDGKVELIVSGLPTSAIKNYCTEHFEVLKKYLDTGLPFVSLSKGIDSETLELSDDLFEHKFLDYKEQFAFLSGPSFAKEIVARHVTTVSVASRSFENLTLVSKMLDTDYFKVFKNYDVKGVLLGGALKNVLAIGGGIIEGLGFNHNTRAAMITRGINEMLRFGKVFSARSETFYGLSGMGDLILTVTGDLSRNKSFGLELAKGRTAKEILESKRTVVEGYKTTKAVYHLAQKYDIKCRAFTSVYDVLYNDQKPQDVLSKMMRRSPGFEN